ncbi:hypothetical protein Desti_2336 [Desulfomonile tiedjei DSM 6799]|uniref:Uncharacterized protein n=1 Tax=Desulfomonile tiedjei (strain ATCC 49306 / DSM 6799 / DCB-1) TaxID=706587 RepID=I4C632_DESTA|nr:hypothetical protein Desti_2336 [Desulfomonile tiedjei DSM 6799]
MVTGLERGTTLLERLACILPRLLSYAEMGEKGEAVP